MAQTIDRFLKAIRAARHRHALFLAIVQKMAMGLVLIGSLAILIEIPLRFGFHVGWHNLTDESSRGEAILALRQGSPIQQAEEPIRQAVVDIESLNLPSLAGSIPLVDIVLASPKRPNAYGVSIGPLCIIEHRLGPDAESFITREMIAFGIDGAPVASLRFATAHEAAHCSFSNLGSRDAMLARARSAIDFHPETPEPLREQASEWLRRAWNESYADLIAVALAARTQTPQAFNLSMSSLIGHRFAHHGESLHRAIMQSSGPHLDFDLLDEHATHPAIADALRSEQSKLAGLSGRELEKWALDTSLSALSGHLRTRDSFAFLRQTPLRRLDQPSKTSMPVLSAWSSCEPSEPAQQTRPAILCRAFDFHREP